MITDAIRNRIVRTESSTENPFSLDTWIPTTSSSVFSFMMVSLYLNLILFQKALLFFFFGMVILYELQR